MKNIVFILLIIISVWSCTKKLNIESGAIEIDVFNNNNNNIESIEFESIKIVPIETNKDKLLGGQLKIKLVDNEIYIADQNTHNCIFRYNNDGFFINRIGTPGNGPNEYSGLTDFIVHGDTVDILAGKGEYSMITGHNKNGNYLYSKEFKLNTVSFEKIKSVYYLSGSYNNLIQDYRLYAVDENGKIISKLLHNDTKLNIPISEDKFFKFDSLLYYKEAFDNAAYQIINNDIEKIYILNFGKHSIPDEFYKCDFMKGLDLLNMNSFANIKEYFDNNTFALFVIILQEMNNSEIHNILYNKKLGNFSKQVFIPSDKMCLKKIISLNSQDELVYLVYPDEIINDKNELKKLPIVNYDILANMDEMDNPVLFYCKVKKK